MCCGLTVCVFRFTLFVFLHVVVKRSYTFTAVSNFFFQIRCLITGNCLLELHLSWFMLVDFQNIRLTECILYDKSVRQYKQIYRKITCQITTKVKKNSEKCLHKRKLTRTCCKHGATFIRSILSALHIPTTYVVMEAKCKLNYLSFMKPNYVPVTNSTYRPISQEKR